MFILSYFRIYKLSSHIVKVIRAGECSVREFKARVSWKIQGNLKGILLWVFVVLWRVPKGFTERNGCKQSCHVTQVRMALFVYIIPLALLI